MTTPGTIALLPTATGRETVRTVLDALRPDRGRAVAAAVLLVAATGVGMLVAPLLGRIVDVVVGHGAVSAVLWTAAGIALAALVQGAGITAGEALLVRAGEGTLARMRERFVDRCLAVPAERLEAAGSGDLTARASHDIAAVGTLVRQSLPAFVRAGLVIALTLVGLLVLDVRFALAALVAVPVQVLAARAFVRRATPLYAEQRVALGALQQQLLDTVGGARTVLAHRLEERHREQVATRSRSAIALVVRGVVVGNRFYGRLNAAELIGLAAVLATGFLLVRADAVSLGTATAAALYFHGLFGPINVALGLLDEAQAAAASLARVAGVVGLPPRPRTDGPQDAEPEVVGVGLGHAYRTGAPVLHEVDLRVPPGERLAVVGASGAGKSTLGRIAAGVLTPTEGHLHVGGRAPVPGRTAVLITQETHVFAGPLVEDLRLFRPDATDAEIGDALAAVGAREWAAALPDGLDTAVGDGGHPLSATQSQQLALARLVLAAPPTVVLDEATAEAGSASAGTLQAAVEAAVRGRTALVIAHRLDQAAAADRVLVLEAGRVVESGTHADLVRAGGRYAELWTAWSPTEAPAPTGRT